MKRSFVAALVVAGLAAGACSSGGDSSDGGDGLGDPGDCIVVDATLSPEKIDLVTEFAQTFNRSDAARDGDRCWFVSPHRKSSGASATALYTGWDTTANGPEPVLWSPAASTWGQVVDQRLTEGGQSAIVPDDFERFMLTPLVIAMPKPLADALGYPQNPVGWADILALATAPDGWASVGFPEFGPFRLGKTNPNFSTSGLSALIAQTYAALDGQTTGLTLENLADPRVVSFATGVESAVVHYGDTTLTFLNNLYRADLRDNALGYVSAVAVEEKSVLDYNRGNPDGILDPGEDPRPPRVPLVPIYPEEGTLYSDNPLFVLDAPWVSDEEAEGARRFVDFVLQPDNQERVLEFGFRPANTEVSLDPLAADGVDPNQPATLLEVPDPEVMIQLLDNWEDQRKRARVMLVLDVSGSMGEPADPSDPGGPTRLDLAKDAAIQAISLFAPDDEIALRVFTNDLDEDGLFGPDDPQGDEQFRDLVGYGPVDQVGEAVRNQIRNLRPLYGTPLYDVTSASYQAALDGFDPSRINAVVLLTDGVNDDGEDGDDDRQLDDLVAALEDGSEGSLSRPVRVFTIAYSADAAADSLARIANASSAASYESTDPTSILQVLTAVISNF